MGFLINGRQKKKGGAERRWGVTYLESYHWTNPQLVPNGMKAADLRGIKLFTSAWPEVLPGGQELGL